MPPATLQLLPFDVLFEIMRGLRWSDVLRLQHTCSHLKAASTERSVWDHLLKHYQATLQPRKHWPDRPIGFYDKEELQELVLRPFKVDHAWNTDDVTPSSRCSFSVGKIAYSVQLIRGGRWLLVGTFQGEILYFDLDAPVVEPHVLVPSAYISTTTHVYPVIAIDMDDDEPYITFKLAVITHGDGRRPIQVWKIQGLPDEKGRVLGLTSRVLSSFSEDPRCLVGCLCLRGNRLGYFRQDLRVSVVVDWTTALQFANPVQRVIIPPEGHDSIFLLPNEWVFCATGSSVYLYNFEDLSEEPDYITTTPAKAQFLLMVQGPLTPFVVGDSTQFVFRGAGGKTIERLIIPHSDPTQALIMTLHSNFPCDWNDKVIVGYQDAVVFHHDGRFSVVFPSCDGSGKLYTVSPKAFAVPEKGWCYVDRISGRIVVLHRQGQGDCCIAISI